MINTNILYNIIVAIVGMIIGFVFRVFIDRYINKSMKYDEIVLNNEIDMLKDKLDIYWPIYFKLLICMSANIQIKKIKNTNITTSNMIEFEMSNILKNLEDVVTIITLNVRKLDLDDNFLDLILRFITHVHEYKSLKQLNIIHKTPSDYGYPYPDDFTKEITRRTIESQEKYDNYLGNKYKNKISVIYENPNNVSNYYQPQQNKIDLSFQKKLVDIYNRKTMTPSNNHNSYCAFYNSFDNNLNSNFYYDYNNDNINSHFDIDEQQFMIDPNDINLDDVFINHLNFKLLNNVQQKDIENNIQ